MKKQILAVVACLALVIGGCSFSSAMTQLQKYMPVALQAFEGVVAILVETGALGAAQGSSADAVSTAASAALSDVQSAVTAYNAAPAASKATKLGEVVTALSAAQTQLKNFLADAHVKSSSAQATIQAAVLLISTTLASIEASISPNPTPAQVMAKASIKKVSASDFKKSYNQIVTSGGFGKHAL